MKNYIAIFLVFLQLVGCAAMAPLPTLGSHSYNPDVALPEINVDAYTVVLPPIPDVRLTMPTADGGAGPNGEAIVALHLHQAAPWPGVLFNGPALAFVEVEYRGQAERCLIDRRADLERVGARALADIRNLQATIGAQRTAYDLMLHGRDEEITRLYTYAQHQNSNPLLDKILWAGGGLLLGVGLTSVYIVLSRP